MLPLPLIQMLSIIGPLVGTILHYAKGNSYNQKVFWHGCNGPIGFQFWLKRKGKDHSKSPKFHGIRNLSVITMNAHSFNPRIAISQLKVEFNIVGLTQLIPFSFLQIIQRVFLPIIYYSLFFSLFLFFFYTYIFHNYVFIIFFFFILFF